MGRPAFPPASGFPTNCIIILIFYKKEILITFSGSNFCGLDCKFSPDNLLLFAAIPLFFYIYLKLF